LGSRAKPGKIGAYPPIASYAGWFANQVSIPPVSIDLVSQTDTHAVVHSVVQTTDRRNGQEVTTGAGLPPGTASARTHNKTVKHWTTLAIAAPVNTSVTA
jgi:hypothetical protein